jgi:hypothetical protein
MKRTFGLLVALAPLVLAACQPLAAGTPATGPTQAVQATSPVTPSLKVAPVAMAPAPGSAATRAAPAAPTTAMGSTGAVTGTAGVTTTARAGAMAAPDLAAAAAPGDIKTADMLTPVEAERATQLALGSPDTATVVTSAVDRDAVNANSEAAMTALSSRPSYRVIYSERAPDKEAVGRAAEVAIYRYDTNQALMNHVDLATGKVTAQSIPSDYLMPLAADEVTEATTVARNDEGVTAALIAAGMDPAKATANALLTVANDKSAVCASHRCARLFFFTPEKTVPTFSVVVDLSTLHVVEVQPFDTTNGSTNP